jgi:pyruvate,water dikinase
MWQSGAMSAFWRRGPLKPPGTDKASTVEQYQRFQRLLALNNEALELIASLQEDLRFIPPRRDVLGDRLKKIFETTELIVATLGGVLNKTQPKLTRRLSLFRSEVESFLAFEEERAERRLAASLSEIGLRDSQEAGDKAAALGEVKNGLGLPVPDGYVITTETYWRFFGLPSWRALRDTLRGLSPDDMEGLKRASDMLMASVREAPVPRAAEVAIEERAKLLGERATGLAVRSSAVGEGGERTFAGQFSSLLNVEPSEAVQAYKEVVASRFSERALFYRLSRGLPEVESPMAVLVLPLIRAKAAGIMYTRNPANPNEPNLWITSTLGLGLDIASGRSSADLFAVARGRSHPVLEQRVAAKEKRVDAAKRGGLMLTLMDEKEAKAPSLHTEEIQILADWGVRLEEYFGCPQDVEWVLDADGSLWIVQTRPLAVASESQTRQRFKPRGRAAVEGGTTVFPGRTSGPAFVLEEGASFAPVPKGAVLIARRPSPDMVPLFPRIAGFVAEGGNVTGHAATLLREYRVPSIFAAPGLFQKEWSGKTVSLDAGEPALYEGELWPPRSAQEGLHGGHARKKRDPIGRRVLALNLLNPAALNFRQGGCRSVHDVLRFCHERAISAMFEVNDFVARAGPKAVKRLETEVPVNFFVLDLGGGVSGEVQGQRTVPPGAILCAPFQAFWRGVSNPNVAWRREAPPSLDGLASVLAGSFSNQAGPQRGLGEQSYLMIAPTYMNLNSRLAYHFSLIDASLTDIPNNNHIAFRFAGGGATQWRRNLRAAFLEAVLLRHGFQVDRRGDLINAWLKKATAAETSEKLDILGRLMACASQLDMYMTSEDVMRAHVEAFLGGDYAFRTLAPKRDDGVTE